MPKVSVVIISYNHASYVAAAIASVLRQTFTDFELIIADDASTDGSQAIIRGFTDPRIHTIFRDKNVGACRNFNLALSQASGDYVAILSSDDIYMPEKLARQVAILDTQVNTGAVFTYLEIINKRGVPYRFHPLKYFKRLFNLSNRPRHDWLQLLFQNNCLGFPSVMIRASVFEHAGLLDERLCTYPDYEWCVRLCLAGYELHIIPEELTLFRRMPRGSNMSAKTLPVYNRGRFEHRKLLEHFLGIPSSEEFKRIFKVDIQGASDEMVAYYIACEALRLRMRTHREFALDTLYALLADRQKAESLRKRHGFSVHDFYELTGTNALGYPKSVGHWLSVAVTPLIAIRLHDLTCGFFYKRDQGLPPKTMKWVA